MAIAWVLSTGADLLLTNEERYCVVICTHAPAIAEASDPVYHMEDGVLRGGQ